MTSKIWFSTGLTSLALILGFLVGGSHSPVAGVAITAAFGLAVPFFSLLGGRGDVGRTDRLATAGKVLTVFCLVFVVGMSLGAYSRLQDWPAPTRYSQVFPWKDQPPKTAYHAIDWIIVGDRLRSLGYNNEQIQQVYAIQKAEWGNAEPATDFGGVSSLFSDKGKYELYRNSGGLFVEETPKMLQHPLPQI
jgi:hypothetical protein